MTVVEASSPANGSRKGWLRHLPISIVALAGAAISFAGFLFASSVHQRMTIRHEFIERVTTHAFVVGQAIDRYLDMVDSIGGLHSATSSVERHEFQAFTMRALARYPGITGVGWVPRVPADQRATVEAAARRDGIANFRITERASSGRIIPAGQRDEYFPIYYIAPSDNGARAVGFDLGSTPARREAMLHARDTGKPAATQRIKLLSETGERYSFVVFSPLYKGGRVPETVAERREALIGFATGAFRIADLVENSMRDEIAAANFDTYLYDENSPPAQRFLHYRPSSLRDAQSLPLPLPEAEVLRGIVHREDIRVADRVWTVVHKPPPDFLSRHWSATPWIILGISLLLTGMLVVYLASARSRTRRVEYLVAERSRELTEANNALQVEVAERKRVQEVLSQTQKMDAVGQLTGGIAHDFNNLLMVIDGYARRAAKKLGDDVLVAQSIAEVIKAAEKAANLTKQLLVFSRRQVMEKRVFRVGDVIEDIRGLLLRSVGELYELQFEIEEGDLCVETDPSEFSQAILNLAINARDAMPKGGWITVAAKQVDLAEEFTFTRPNLQPGRFVEVSVTDHGQGIDPNVLPRVFEPFFTTKEQGKGTGLGLAMVYSFAQQSGGTIDIDSVWDEGTVVRFYLPVVDRQPRVVASAADTGSEVGGETILLVEDDEQLLALTGGILEDLGYQVLSAGNGLDALEVDEEYEGTIDLLLTDVVMPSLGGFEIADLIRGRRPGIKIVFMSGYPRRAQGDAIVVPDHHQFLQKPIEADKLAQALRAVFDESETRIAV